jgi:hypothetical protein
MAIIATIAVVGVFHEARKEQAVIRVVNRTSRQVGHVQVLGLGRIGDFGVLPPGASRSVGLEGKTPMTAISLSFANVDGNVKSTGTILNPLSAIAGRQIEVPIKPDESVSVSSRDLTLREKLGW